MYKIRKTKKVKSYEALLQFKWTTSRGRDTYGYNISSLYVNGHKVASCNGGGYDMQGTCLGDFLSANFQDELKKLHSGLFYGLFHSLNSFKKFKNMKHSSKNTKTYCDGGCGWNSMINIANAIGLEIKYQGGYKDNGLYLCSGK